MHIAYPPPHNVIQDLEGLEFDMRNDDRKIIPDLITIKGRTMEIRRKVETNDPTNLTKFLPCLKPISRS